MSPTHRAAWLALLQLACTPSIEARDSGSEPDAGAMLDAGTDAGPACPSADTVCPPYVPPAGHSCVGDLTCTYDDFGVECRDGAWQLTEFFCLPSCLWPVAERCDDAVAISSPGATFTIGPPDEARAFEDGELVDAVWGPQGSPMLAYAIRIDDEDAPACVTYDGDIDEGGLVRRIGPRPLRVYCGRSRTVYTELAHWPCEEGVDAEARLTLSVEGIDGEVTARVRVRGQSGAPCP